jgi:hypothetical protein
MQIDEGKRGFGLTGVDCKGFDPLNRSTCSSGITGGRRRSISVSVRRDFYPQCNWF